MLAQIAAHLTTQSACIAAALLCVVLGACLAAGLLAAAGWRSPSRPAAVDRGAALSRAVDEEVAGARIVGRSQAGLLTSRSSTGYGMVRSLREVPELQGVAVDEEAVAALDAVPLALSRARDECLAVGYSTCRGEGDAVAFAVGRKGAVVAMPGGAVACFPKSSAAAATAHGGLLFRSPDGSWAFVPRICSMQSYPLQDVLARFEPMAAEERDRLLRERQVRLLASGIARAHRPDPA